MSTPPTTTPWFFTIMKGKPQWCTFQTGLRQRSFDLELVPRAKYSVMKRQPYPAPPVVRPCVHCGNVPTTVKEFPQDGCIIIERYCAACLEPEFYKHLQDWYGQF